MSVRGSVMGIAGLVALAWPGAAGAAITPRTTVLGAPDAADGRGALVLAPLDGKGSPRTYTAADLGLPPSAPGDRFGAAVAASPQGTLVVGAPGRAGRGAVYVVGARRRGDDGAFTLRRGRRLAVGFAPGDELGAAVAVAAASGGAQHVWMGAPGRRGGQGEVTHRLLRGLRGTGATTTFVPGTAAAPGAGGRFGAVLAATGRAALAGLPDADGPGGEPAAGAVVRLKLLAARPTGSGAPARRAVRFGAADGQRLLLPQPRAGDRFGAALAAQDRLVAGAPGVDAPGVPDAGAVAGLRSASGRLAVGRVLPPATPAPGGAYGADVATGVTFFEQSYTDLAVAAPGAGTVTIAGREDPAGLTLTVPGGVAAIGATVPDYTEEDLEQVLVVATAGGAALQAARPGFRFDETRLEPLGVAGLGRLVPARPWTD